MCFVVRCDEHDAARQLVEFEAHEQVTETMSLARHEDTDAWARVEVVQRPLHCELFGYICERARELVVPGVHVELDPLQEESRFGIRVLIRFDDVAARV